MLRNIQFENTYESRFEDGDTLVDRFYRPLLEEVRWYDRIAGYLSLQSLANALQGTDALLQKDGRIRVIAGSELYESDRDILFPDEDDPLPPRVKSQLAIIATLLEQDKLEIKIATTADGSGMFHAKLGIGIDSFQNKVTFEGSVNETVNAWERNFERFKLHRHWKDGEEKYVHEDINTFERIWEDNHESVDVYPLPEAEKNNLIDWKDYGGDIDDHVERVRETSPTEPVDDQVAIDLLRCAGKSPGGIHLAEDIATITPWPHQRTISDTACSIYPENLLFCDEVGLGKTIEAGLTVSRLLHTGEASNALFLTPAGLMEQWQDELLSLFNIHAYRVDNRYDGVYLVGPDSTGDEIKLDEISPVDKTTREWGSSIFADVIESTDGPDVVIESWHRARRDANVGDVAPDVSNDVWDITVVDEAHNASANGPNDTTKLYDLLGAVEDVSACMYALSATPMQLEVGDLHDLLRLCDLPDSWDSKQSFREFFETRQALQTIIPEIDTEHLTDTQARQEVIGKLHRQLELKNNEGRLRLAQFGQMVMDHLQERDGYDERVKRVVEETDTNSISQRKSFKKLLGLRQPKRTDTGRGLMFDCTVEQWGALTAVTEWASPVQSRIFRNGRSVLKKCEDLGLDVGNIPERKVKTKRIPLGDDVRPIYEEIEDYISDTYKQSQKLLTGREKNALGFVMTTYQQRLTSSISAIQQSLQRRKEKIDTKGSEITDRLSELSEDGSVSEATLEKVVGQEQVDSYAPSSGEAMSIIQSEKQALNELVDTLQSLTTDPKLAQLHDDIRSFGRQGKDKIIIFTQYTDTLEYIRDAIVQTHTKVGTYSGDGGYEYSKHDNSWKEVGKEAITQRFKTGAVRLLVCNEAASEGLNLQTADALINYDLPWNPMRVEQRIGRIDRIGQENDTVEIVNYAYEDSIDGDIYEQLEKRLNLFEDVVGKMRPILSDLESDIRAAAIQTPSNQETVDGVLQTAEQKAETAKEKINTTGLGVTHGLDTQEEIINESGINGWDACHPGLSTIGKRAETEEFTPVINHTLVERVLTESATLRSAGWIFTSVRNHDAVTEYEDVKEEVYVLQVPDSYNRVSLVGDIGMEAAQTVLRDTDTVAVTFNPDVAADYTSLRLLLPGDPVYRDIIEVLNTSDSRTEFVCLSQNGSITVQQSIESPNRYEVILPAIPQESVEFTYGLEVQSVSDAENSIDTYKENRSTRYHESTK